ncbi:MAG: hypothetical protein Q7S50_03355 [bacterium]|nr:hypothetical protein [bacterium]
MTTQVVFNIDPKIKARAMKRAKSEGIPFASVLKFATKAFADGALSLEMVEEIRPEKLQLMERASRALDQGKGKRFNSVAELRKHIRSL